MLFNTIIQNIDLDQHKEQFEEDLRLNSRIIIYIRAISDFTKPSGQLIQRPLLKQKLMIFFP